MLVVAVALFDESGRVLMQKRPRASQHGGLWEFPGGKLEPGESPERAALREILEELGLELEVANLSPLVFASDQTADAEGRRPVVILLYTCRIWHGAPQCLAAERTGWFDPTELAGLAMPPLDYPLAEALLQSI